MSVDVGGTFTDVVVETSKGTSGYKLLTDHAAPENGIGEGVSRLLAKLGKSYSDIDVFLHGTTLATNAVLERKGAKTGFLTTAGFRDVLEIGYENRHNPMDLNLTKPTPIAARDCRLTLDERIAADGTVLKPLDTNEIEALVPVIRSKDIESLAVGFLHSYLNPAHERLVQELLAARLPGLPISLSSEICPEIREYERFSTACLNAYVKPIITRYLARLKNHLSELGLRCPILIMASSGGLIPVSHAIEAPIQLIESGPAGGAVLAAEISAEIGANHVMSFDMGGTTAKICFLEHGKPNVTRLFEVDRTERFMPGSGLPLRAPVVELVEIGAGGGSIARVDAMRRITIGPESAGSNPGPACYGLGGSAATITDADFLLGKIDGERFAGGEINLNKSLASDALGAGIATKQGISEVEAAFSVTEIVDETMSNAARAHAAELGRDLSSHTMIAFGGAAPLHAARIAKKLGVKRLIIPKSAGVGSAVGFLRAPVAFDVAVSTPGSLSGFDPSCVSEAEKVAESRIQSALDEVGFGDQAKKKTFMDLRYLGQGHEVEIELPGVLSVPEIKRAFECRYKSLFGRLLPDAEIEIVSVRVRVAADIAGNEREEFRLDVESAEPETTEIFDARLEAFTPAKVIERSTMMPGPASPGPALVREDQTTTVVPAGFDVRVLETGHLLLVSGEE